MGASNIARGHGKGKEYPGNDQIEHNATAIATLGLLALYLKERMSLIVTPYCALPHISTFP